jgi:hypothetical protein
VTGGAAGEGTGTTPPPTGVAGRLVATGWRRRRFLRLQTVFSRLVPRTRTLRQTLLVVLLVVRLRAATSEGHRRGLPTGGTRPRPHSAHVGAPAAPSLDLRSVPRSILVSMATPTADSTPQRLAAIRAQMSLLADYL